MACQIPLRFGFPSLVRGAFYAGACPETGITATAIKADAAHAAIVKAAKRLRIYTVS